ncbi:hypothetical protein Trydic_g13548, partial [Trypoxylus dichotomus]
SLERDVVVTSQPIYATKRTESNTPSASRTDRTTDIQSLSSNIIIEQRCPFVRNAVVRIRITDVVDYWTFRQALATVVRRSRTARIDRLHARALALPYRLCRATV